MNEFSTPQVSRVEGGLSGRAAGTGHSADPAAARPAAKAPASKPPVEAAPAEKPANPFQDVSIKFKVDAKTNDVTIMILDRATRKVVRTIPPEEMNRMDPGELLELFT
jgi:hypothetical protein